MAYYNRSGYDDRAAPPPPPPPPPAPAAPAAAADDRVVPTLRVAGSSDPKSMATAIESRIVEYRAVKLEAVGANSVNQATKAIAIARVNLENDNRSLAGFPDFIHIKAKEEGASEKSAIQFYLFAVPPRRAYEDPYYDRYRGYAYEPPRELGDNARTVRVSQKSEAKTMAVTISSGLRMEGEIRVQAVGAGSVNAAVKSIAIARRTLADSGELDVTGFPEFVRVPAPTTGEREHSALRWTLYGRPIRPPPPAQYPPARGGAAPPAAAGRSGAGAEEGGRRPGTRGGRGAGGSNAKGEKAATAPPPHTLPPYRADKTEEDLKVQELRVASGSDPKAVAGAIATRIRTGGNVRITVMGPASVNQTVKALAVARTYVEEEGADFATIASFIHLPGTNEQENERSAIQLTLFPCSPLQADQKELAEYKVAGTTNPKATAGAIANCVRENKKCKLEALGRDAVSQAIKAVAIGRANLEEDNVDIVFAPAFRTMYLSNGRRSALELTIFAVHPPK